MPLSVWDWDDKGLKFWALPWGTFDHDGLKAALIAAGAPSVNEEIVVRAVGWICRAWSNFRAGKQATAAPSKKLRDLHKALSEFVDDPQWMNSWEGWFLRLGDDPPLPVWLGGGGDDMSIVEEITRLTQRVDWVIKYLESRDTPRGKQEDPLTTFFVSLYVLYTIVSGKTGLTDGGPGHRFVKECAALVDPSIIVPARGFRQLIQAASARRSESEPTCKNGPAK